MVMTSDKLIPGRLYYLWNGTNMSIWKWSKSSQWESDSGDSNAVFSPEYMEQNGFSIASLNPMPTLNELDSVWDILSAWEEALILLEKENINYFGIPMLKLNIKQLSGALFSDH